MGRLIAIMMAVAFLAAWWWLLYQRSDRRMRSPIWLAFTTTAAAALFLVSGSIGYVLDKRSRFAGGAWSETVIWWEVGVGIALLPLAVYFWRRGARDIDRRLGRA